MNDSVGWLKVDWWEWLKRLSATIGVVSVVVVFGGWMEWFPGYDVTFKKKSEITPGTHVFPGSTVRLIAEFARAVTDSELEKVEWNAVNSSGQKYRDLQGNRQIDVVLLPDYSGIVNVTVKAKVRNEGAERVGSGSIHIAQTSPRKLEIAEGRVQLPFHKSRIDPGSLQIYEGANRWAPVPAAAVTEQENNLILKDKLPVWDDKAFVRYKLTDDPSGPFKYEALLARQPGGGS
jgi:hypothetical protein